MQTLQGYVDSVGEDTFIAVLPELGEVVEIALTALDESDRQHISAGSYFQWQDDTIQLCRNVWTQEEIAIMQQESEQMLRWLGWD